LDDEVLNMDIVTNTVSTDNGPHHDVLIGLIPEAIKQAPAHRLQSLEANLNVAKQYSSWPAAGRVRLQQLVHTHWQLQGDVDASLKHLEQNIEDFARPLLTEALKSQLKVDLDVDATMLRLYVPDKIIFGIDRGATRSQHSTLLAAALHNFEQAETEDGYFRSGSGVYVADADGAPVQHAITVGEVASVCRSLDIGAQYQQHLKALLLPDDVTKQATLRTQSVAVEKSALEVAAAIAGMNADLGMHAQAVISDVISGQRSISFHGRALKAHRLRIMGLELSGIVLFSAVAEKNEIEKFLLGLVSPELQFLFDWSRRIPGLNDNLYEKYKVLSDVFANGPSAVTDEMSRRNDFYDQSILNGPLVAYIPDDPLHPLKEYPSLTAFMKALATQLLEKSYQQFFSRFVAQKDKPKFFRRVNERLKEITWHQREPLDMGPWWRETPIETPHAEPITVPIQGGLWEHLYLRKRDKSISDARLIAVPTGDEDAKSRWNRLISYLDYGWNIFNFVVMLVPGVGEVMLGVMVAQLLAEFAEGIEDWSHGDKEEACAHINSVILNFTQLALMSAGHILPKGAVAIKPSSFVDNLKAVPLADGRTKMWNPDLAPYAHNLALPAGTWADESGLYPHQGKKVLHLQGRQYVVKEDPLNGQFRMQHPTRADAYAPRVEHNRAGAWKSEVERPLEWEQIQLLRRLNPLAATFSESTLAQVLKVSGIDDGVLRRLHVEHELPPPLLTDTLNRFDLYASISQFGEQIRNGHISDHLSGYLPGLLTELPRWPESKAITLKDPLPTGRDSITYGNSNAAAVDTLIVSQEDIQTGNLEGRVLAFLDETEIEALLGRAISTDKTVRVQALREALAQRATKRASRVFESQYKTSDVSADMRVRRLHSDYPELPCSVIEQVLKDADPQSVRVFEESGQVVLKLRQQLRTAGEKVRLNRAYEGLYLEQLESTDSHRLVLRSMESLPGWSAQVRIDIRELAFDGRLQASVGAADAPIRKVLIADEDGLYSARDEQGLQLHSAEDLYSAVLHALPDAQRQALGFDIFQGDLLKQAIQRSPLSHEQFEQVLLENPVRKPAYDPENMRLRGGMQGYPLRPKDWSALKRRVGSLYPAFTDAQVESLLDGFGANVMEMRVAALEKEFSRFNLAFQRWLNDMSLAYRFSPEGVAEWTSRNRVYQLLRQCWQRTGPAGPPASGVIRAQALVLNGLPMDRHLLTMPRLTASFDHVTSLSLQNGQILSDQQHFLGSFRQLRDLDLWKNRLSDFPEVISNMAYLRVLTLSDNQISLTAESAARLRAMSRLHVLKLDGNPLGKVPDISQMPALLILSLDSTGIDTWPIGLFAKQRPRNLYLDLRFNQISELPDVAPGSIYAELIARTNVSRDAFHLSAENLEKLKRYIESVGLDPDRPYPSRGTIDSSYWDAGMSEAEWNARQPLWDEVEDEFGAEPFFNELRKLTASADFGTTDSIYRTDLTAKVWRMIFAMNENTALREKIFAEAVASTTCADAGAQFFNAMGVEVLVHEAYGLISTDLVEAELVALARGKSRLDELGQIARQRVADRLKAGETFRRENADGVTGSIDEVEVHMAYMTDLADRLDLPWQSRGMLFRKVAGVTEKMIEDAYQRVIALEEGELLAPRILEQPFWQQFLKRTYRTEFDELLTSLKDEDDMAQFEALQTLEKSLTQKAIDRAKLQTVYPPFTVQP
jgi:hypothetical protein